VSRLIVLIGIVGIVAITVSTRVANVHFWNDVRGVVEFRMMPQRIVRFLAVGDVNLGRGAGQEILRGDTLYPFAATRDTLASYDLVFANLECTLSDQNGETQHPKNNLIFTGPPEGAEALRKAGIHVVSTANNHALDYGVRAHAETIDNLRRAGVAFVGTALDSTRLFEPVTVTRNGIQFAFFACTDVMNITDRAWLRYVAQADTARLLRRIRAYRDSVDFIVVSYHGGEEYAERPSSRSLSFTRALIDAGVDLVLGHHPHVSYGVEKIGERYVVLSLGNFVFRQPQHFWTQRSFAFAAEVMKEGDTTRISRFRCLPLLTGFQPRFVGDGSEAQQMFYRIQRYSKLPETENLTW
jgi:poly-gamma-glutamate capsule biosynthesis protein CapA/YwtB (metallophosphatase superfamily)